MKDREPHYHSLCPKKTSHKPSKNQQLTSITEPLLSEQAIARQNGHKKTGRPNKSFIKVMGTEKQQGGQRKRKSFIDVTTSHSKNSKSKKRCETSEPKLVSSITNTHRDFKKYLEDRLQMNQQGTNNSAKIHFKNKKEWELEGENYRLAREETPIEKLREYQK